MNNKKIMKEVFDSEFHPKVMREQILFTIEKKENKRRNLFFKYSISICFFVIVSIAFLANRNLSLKNPDGKGSNSNDVIANSNSNEIIVNSLESEYFFSNSSADIAGSMVEKDLVQDFPFLQNIKVPEQYSNERKMYQYQNNGDTLGYHVLYFQDYQEKIDIFFSPTLPLKPRCISIPDDLEFSSIHNTDVKILGSKNFYIALFQFGDVYFDIEAKDLSQEEFIMLLESIIG